MKNQERLPLILSYISNAERCAKEIYAKHMRARNETSILANTAATDLSAARRLLETEYGTTRTSDS